ncbi:MAG TPA: 50S ribosomal protein L6 [Deltaproteobacteria bacterium]|nr:50S ribosomal protein L6 [Candidatus Binatota bacterium]HIL13574.1 50S ribosomal protein L6 [Deltaproteobacteria bacterium]
MSRTGRNPIVIPDGVKVSVDGQVVNVQGPKGSLSEKLPGGISITIGDAGVVVERSDDSREQRMGHGLARRLVENMVVGVTAGFSKVLLITGVGYRADVKGNLVHLTLGFSHPIIYQLPEGVDAAVADQTTITISGSSRQNVGQVAAEIRSLRPPEPYKGKGVRYSDEQVRRKAGKAAAA